ncbi:hypothetical protein BHM03_00055093, partial [Ensete ventricosum]
MTNLSDDGVLVVAGGEVVAVDDALDHLMLACMSPRTSFHWTSAYSSTRRDIDEALAEHLLVPPCCASTIFAPNHVARFQG